MSQSYSETAGRNGYHSRSKQSRPALTDFDRDAELRLVSCVTKPDITAADIQNLPPASDITDETSRNLYAAAIAVIAERNRFDASLVKNRLRESGGEPDNVYLLEIRQTSAHLKYIHDYAAIVHQLAVIRRVKDLGMYLIETATQHAGDASSLLSQVDIAVSGTHRAAAGEGSASDLVSFNDAIEDAWSDMTNPGSERFLPTGIPSLDYAIGGLFEGEITTLAGTPGSGKTSLAMAFCIFSAMETQKRWLIVSKEMSPKQLARRCILMRAGVNGMVARRANQYPEKYGLTNDESMRLQKAKKELSALRCADGSPQIMIVPPIEVSADFICSMIRREKMTRGLDAFAVDYLQILDQVENRGGSESNQEQKIARDAQKFKDVALAEGLAGLVLSQLVKTTSAARPAGKDGKAPVPTLGDLKGSGGIAAASDTVLILHRTGPADDSMDSESEGSALPVKVDCVVAKGRNSGIGAVPLNFEPQYTRFSERENDPTQQKGSAIF